MTGSINVVEQARGYPALGNFVVGPEISTFSGIIAPRYRETNSISLPRHRA